MIEVYKNLFIGNENDFEQRVKNQLEWRVVHACKHPYHKNLLGYTCKAAPKNHPEYLIDFSLFDDWYSKVAEICSESGHIDIARNYIGKVLFYSPKDPNGFWINLNIAEWIDRIDKNLERDSFTSEIYNSRGVHSIDSSGKIELSLAEHWKQKMDALEKEGFINFATSLKRIISTYIKESERNISEFSEE